MNKKFLLVLVWIIGGVVFPTYIGWFLWMPPILDSDIERFGVANSVVCDTQSQIEPSLVIYAEWPSKGEVFTKHICEWPQIKRRYGQVIYYWALDDIDFTVLLRSGDVALAYGRPHQFDDKIVAKTIGYTRIVSFPSYTWAFIETQKLNLNEAKSFAELQIGLLKGEKSRSGYLEPLTRLRQLGLRLKDLRVKYFASHNDLRTALMNGEVDVIGSYWNDELQQRFPQAIAHFGGGVSGTAWYAQTNFLSTNVACEFQELILAMGRTSDAKYWRSGKGELKCN